MTGAACLAGLALVNVGARVAGDAAVDLSARPAALWLTVRAATVAVNTVRIIAALLIVALPVAA
jgi:hypothetical protein